MSLKTSQKMKFLFPLFLFCTFFSFTQTENLSSLKIEEIMKGKDFIGYWPENPYWHITGEQIIFSWNPKNEIMSSTYCYQLKTKTITPVNKEDKLAEVAYDPSQAAFPDQYYLLDGNLWVWDKKTKKQKEIISSSFQISKLQRLSNPKEIVYQQDLNLFLYNAEHGTIRQLTYLQRGFEQKEIEPENSMLENQQENLFLFIQEKKAKQKFLEENRKKQSGKTNFYLGKNQLNFIEVSNDGQFVFFSTGFYPENKETEVAHHISENGYTLSKKARPKVGETEPLHTFYIYNLEKDSIYALNFDQLPDIRKKPAFLKEYGDTEPLYKENRKLVYHPPISFKEKVVMDIRSYDNKDRWIVQIDAQNARFTLIDHQQDEAWIGGPGISSWNESPGNLGFWNKGEDLFYQSEKTGYSHLYSYHFQSKTIKQLTNGDFEIHNTYLAKDQLTFYITCNKNHPGNREFYKFHPSKNEWTSIATQMGAHEISLSPDEQTFFDLFSDKNSPWELFLGKNEKQSSLVQITQSTSKDFQTYAWTEPEVIQFKGIDGQTVYARLYPAKKENKNGAGVIFVHGAGYLQNAHNYWSQYYREFMFHHFLTDNGFTVLDIDFRASEGYGRDFRTDIYRHMGGLDLSDQVSGKQFLVDSLAIDSTRVGLYGGSYGGFITLMALLTKPNEFACGAALRSVTDWMHYNHEYTSNILNYPSNDSIAYNRSSPINFAQNLTDPLLMLHGMVDDNVQFQDVVRLSQRFIELGKKNWNLAVFPVEAHGFEKAYSWTDEYRRIYELFQTYLLSK